MQRLARPQTLSRILPGVAASRVAPSRVAPSRFGAIRTFTALTTADVHNTHQPPIRGDIYAVPAEEESLMSKYGWYPVTALVGAIVVSKEVIQINDSIVAIINFTLVMLGLYVGTADAINKSVATAKADDEKYYKECTELELSCVEEAIKMNEAIIAKPEVMESYLKQYEAASVHYDRAQKMLVQLALRNAVEAKLAGIQEREARQARDQKDKIAAGARAWFMAKFQSSPDLQRNAIERAIQSIGHDQITVPEAQDPIRQLFHDYIAEAKRTMQK